MNPAKGKQGTTFKASVKKSIGKYCKKAHKNCSVRGAEVCNENVLEFSKRRKIRVLLN